MKLRNVISVTLLSASLAAGCSLFAPKADYRAYRQVELAENEHDRSLAIAQYLQQHPEGQWSAQLAAEHTSREAAVFDTNKNTADGLRHYLSLYPEGSFVAQAEQRLVALDRVAENREGEQETAREVRRERREDQLEERRRWGTKAITFWSEILLGVNNWGSPISEVAAQNADFNQAFAADPRPNCNAQECVKFYSLDFAIPIPGRTRLDRNLQILLRLRFADGQRLTRAEMLLPQRGFSRWYELEHAGALVEDADPDQRQVAVEWALERLIPIVREYAPDARGVDVVPEPIDPVTVTDGGGAPEAAPEGEELVLPLALAGLSTGELRTVVFAAADDDYGVAHDGFFIELIPEEEREGSTEEAAE